MKWILALFLFLLFIPTASAATLQTYRDAGLTIPSSTFTQGPVYITLTDGITCCTTTTATVTNEHGSVLSVVLNDNGTAMDTKEDTVFTGMFWIGTGHTAITAFHNESLVIIGNLTKFSSGNTSIVTEYLPPSRVNLSGLFSGGKIQLNWSPATDDSGIGHYRIYRQSTPFTEPPPSFFTATTPSFTDATVNDGITYYYAVGVVDVVGNQGPLSNLLSITTPDITPPAAVTNFQAKASASGIRLNWTLPSDTSGIDHVTIYRSTAPVTSLTSTAQPLATVTGTEYFDTAAHKDETYYYAVVAVDTAGNVGPLSDNQVAIIDQTAPKGPTLNLTLLPAGRIRLEWTADNAVSYNLYTSSFPLSTAIGLEPLTLTDTAYTTTLEEPLYYAVTGIDAAGNEGPLSNTIRAVPDNTPPLPPTSFSVHAKETGHIILQWGSSLSSDIHHYTIYRERQPLAEVTGNSYTDTAVQHGTTYTYRVASVDQAGNEGLSPEQTITAEDRFVQLTIQYPISGIHPQGRVAVIGTTDPDATITIHAANVTDVTRDDQGDFIGYAVLNPGENSIQITATDQHGNTNTSTFTFTSTGAVSVDSLETLITRYKNKDIIFTEDVLKDLITLDPEIIKNNDFVSGFLTQGNTNPLFWAGIISALILFIIFSDRRLVRELKHTMGARLKHEQRMHKQEQSRTKRFFQRYISYVPRSLSPGKQLRREKKDITVLFTDIRNFTPLSHRLGSEKTSQLLDMFYKHMADAAQKHGGTVTEYIGDRLMVVFNLEQSLKNHTYQAVKAAFEMKKELELVNERLERLFGTRLSIGSGIKSGEAMVGTVGHERALKYGVSGNTVNVAAKLSDKAGPGDVLIDRDTYEKVQADVKVSSPLPLQISGLELVGYKVLSPNT